MIGFLRLADYSIMRDVNYAYYNRASGFSTVRGIASGGGVDRAYIYDSSSDDLLYGRSNVAQLTNSNIDLKATFFGHVTAYSNSGGTDTLDVETVDYLFNSLGSWT